MNTMMLLEEVEQVAATSAPLTDNPWGVLALFAIGALFAAGIAVSLGLLFHRE